MNTAAVGAFVLVLGAALVAGALWLASGGALRKPHDLYLAIEEESVAGLNLNAPVKFNGVAVGSVHDIRLDPENPARVILTFAIERGTPIKTDTVAVLRTQGLTGIAYVELSGGDRAAPALTTTGRGQYPVIRTKPSISARLENVLTTVLAKLDSTSNNVNAVLSDENRAAFGSALADIATVARTLARQRASLDAAIASSARMFGNGARGTERLGEVIESIGRSADAVARTGDAATLASAKAGATFEAAGADLARFTGQTLPELERLLGELSVLAISLRRLSEQTERNPSGLLFGRTPAPEGPGEIRQER